MTVSVSRTTERQIGHISSAFSSLPAAPALRPRSLDPTIGAIGASHCSNGPKGAAFGRLHGRARARAAARGGAGVGPERDARDAVIVDLRAAGRVHARAAGGRCVHVRGRPAAPARPVQLLPLAVAWLACVARCVARCGLTRLTLLDLSHNSIKMLPHNLGAMVGLQELYCHNNELTFVPNRCLERTSVPLSHSVRIP